MAFLMVVDDDPDLLLLLEAHFRACGHEISGVGSCAAALALAAERRPDAILLDFCLPRVDGSRVLEMLRADAATKNIPVIVMSAASSGWISSRLPEDPLMRIVDKPLDFGRLDDLIAKFLTPPAASRPQS